ncbi:MAG: hypothetical protein A2Y62_21230 [Candidatus Fischerbacteria bacterium RBG_13_37_8]|uniref:Uncharacterized protein n=1 Tax=Candidatus Fischerbacteria bacterium RBG_13_37_8 TaxID=1817863 RepID=A0A1F5V4Z5_9BACT|nr:MAG: hypothetical protein A2Y62_21230 [Candidatus Fischerbacteria bacterium RBG_13_37_8]HJX50435.1 hypothetical protein [Candidatus Nanoarchaeia archaeon]
MSEKDYLCLKWGTLKGWDLHSDKGKELLKKYLDIGMNISAMCQDDTPEQKQLILDIIDECNSDTIHLDWDAIDVSKEEAKKYIMEYGKNNE